MPAELPNEQSIQKTTELNAKRLLELQAILVADTPLIDVRAEIEFAAGAFPFARNYPILNDKEREQVGICYKQNGPLAAEQLGHQLVSGTGRESRIRGWCDFIDQNPGTQIYCFRGGLRSTLAQQWLQEQGYQVPKIEGGYKALRRSLLSVFDELPDLIIVAGKTGTGKTEFLARVANKVDLEMRANHRGSAFGKHLTEQPAQIDFENNVALDFLKVKGSPVLIEDESRLIGRINLPLPLQAKMSEAPVILLHDSIENRVERIKTEYISDQWQALFLQSDSEEGAHQALEILFTQSLNAIKKRLGPERHEKLSGMMDDAFGAKATDDFAAHCGWIRALLEEYYDPMYEYQLTKKQVRIIAEGDQDTLMKYAQN